MATSKATEPKPHVARATQVPLAAQRRNVSLSPKESDKLTMTTLAADPSGVRFAPKPTPMASAHHSGPTSIPWAVKLLRMGNIAMVNGTLLMTPEARAPTQRTTMAVSAMPC